jgi:hypothetical protein
MDALLVFIHVVCWGIHDSPFISGSIPTCLFGAFKSAGVQGIVAKILYYMQQG